MRGVVDHKGSDINNDDTSVTVKECTRGHNKVYCEIAFASHPPQFPWICSKCGARGWGTSRAFNPKDPTYSEVFDKFNQKGSE